ncbi:carboxylesterase family protein [Mycobacterium marseillense]|uniref:carboxylesterase/lipase family protein n=1 Tax=Mycobacterium marseillense TaxID=701042 RepID=UPI00259A550E|nr:carboxylesterase family protein [Mycobacterium marseillense]MDM3973556.1 carboxylesterase family protein [Mycobacterium marseillense]
MPSATAKSAVSTPAGGLVGIESETGLAFLGIPYARPPLGDLRFRPPEPAPRWIGHRDAKTYGPSAPQNPDEPGIPYLPLDVGLTSEDCLYLNVWTPAADQHARPVLFWVHGGACTAGAGAEPFYEGARLAAEQDVVVVTINYRLGALGGFVYFNDLGDDRLAQSANVGLLDIALALRWVHDNIAALGGDPDCVTLAGQSAGGKLVATVLAMPAASGLFHRAILQSPGSPNAFEPAEGHALAAEFLRNLGTTDPEAIVEASAEDLWRAALPLSLLTMGPSGAPIAPTIDGSVLPAQVLRTIAAGTVDSVPLLVGSTTHELELMLRGPGMDTAGAEVLAGLAQMFDEPLRDRILAAYSDNALAELSPAAPYPVTALLSDRMVRLGAIRLLEAHANPQTFAYLLEWETQVDSGATHCIELPLLFDTTSVPDAPVLLGSGPDVAVLGRIVRDSWAAFMRTGDPSVAGAAAWPAYTIERRSTLLLGREPAVIDDPWAAQRQAWDGIEDPGGPLPSFTATRGQS